MENHDAEEIYQDTENAPYIHSLLAEYAHTENFDDELPLEIPSEGHYVWMEAGTHQGQCSWWPSMRDSAGGRRAGVTGRC